MASSSPAPRPSSPPLFLRLAHAHTYQTWGEHWVTVAEEDGLLIEEAISVKMCSCGRVEIDE